MLGDDIYRGIKNTMTRRKFLKGLGGLAVVVGSALLGCSAPKRVEAPQHPASAAATPTPETTPESAASGGAKFPNPAQEFGYPYFPACKFEEGYNVPLDKSGRPIPVSEIESWKDPFFCHDDGTRLGRIYGIKTKWVVPDVTDYVEAYADEVLKNSGLIFPEDEDKLDLIKPKKLLLEYNYIGDDRNFSYILSKSGSLERKVIEKINKDGFVNRNFRVFDGSYTMDENSLPKELTCIISNSHALWEKMGGYDYVVDTPFGTMYFVNVPLNYINIDDLSEQAMNKMLRNAGISENRMKKIIKWDYGGNREHFLETLRNQDVFTEVDLKGDGTYFYVIDVGFTPPENIKGCGIGTAYYCPMGRTHKPLVTPEQRKLLKPYIESSLKKLWG